MEIKVTKPEDCPFLYNDYEQTGNTTQCTLTNGHCTESDNFPLNCPLKEDKYVVEIQK